MPHCLFHTLSHSYTQFLCQLIHVGIDYLVNTRNPSSRTFTVVFQSKEANSSEHVILLSDDAIFEGSEYFHLRILAARFNGQTAVIFRAQVGLNNTFADVNIADDDSKLRTSACTICLQIIMKKTYGCLYINLIHCFLQLSMSVGQYHKPLM